MTALAINFNKKLEFEDKLKWVKESNAKNNDVPAK